MGYMRHHAIVVTSSDNDLIERAHAVAVELGMNVTEITAPDRRNWYRSFLVAPDGSKEGWPESETGDACRAALIEHLDGQRYEDGSTSIDWVVVQYGDDEHRTMVVDDSDAYVRTLCGGSEPL